MNDDCVKRFALELEVFAFGICNHDADDDASHRSVVVVLYMCPLVVPKYFPVFRASICFCF